MAGNAVKRTIRTKTLNKAKPGEQASMSIQNPFLLIKRSPRRWWLCSGLLVALLLCVTLLLGRLPAEARGKVFQCDLKKAGIPDYSPLAERGYGLAPSPATLEVFCNGAPLTLARWPNAGFVNGSKIVQPGSKPADRGSGVSLSAS